MRLSNRRKRTQADRPSLARFASLSSCAFSFSETFKPIKDVFVFMNATIARFNKSKKKKLDAGLTFSHYAFHC